MNFPRSELYNDVAAWFQREGFTALVYDPRCVGASDGEPHNEINPAKQTEDIHDAISYFKSLPTVDPKRIVLWGYSLGAAEALAAASADPRIKVVVAICPSANPWDPGKREERNRALLRIMRDRESQLRGNPPFMMRFVGEAEGSVFNIRTLKNSATNKPYELVQNALETVPGFRNQVTAQTLLYMGTWHIMPLLPMISPTPVLVVSAEYEEMDKVKQGAGDIFAALEEPKEKYVEMGRGHFDILTNDERFEGIMKRQMNYIKRQIGEG